MPQAGNNKDVRIAVHETGISGVLDKSGAEEHDVVKLVFQGARSWFKRYCVLPELVGPTISTLNGSFLGSIPLYISVFECAPWFVCGWGGRFGK